MAGVAPGLVTELLQRRRTRAAPWRRPVRVQRAEAVHAFEAQVARQRHQQALLAGAAAARKARQRQQRVEALAALRRTTEGVQPVTDLRFLDLAKIGVEPAQQAFARRVVGGPRQAQLLVQPVAQHPVEDVLAQPPCAPRVQRQGLGMLVHLPFEPLQRAVGLGARHRRHQVVDHDGLSAPLGLRAFAGVVDDEGVEVRQRAEQRIGPALGAQRHALAGQPFEVAVRADVHHRIDREGPAQPEIESDVVVRRHQVGVVVARRRIDTTCAGRLDADEDLAEAQAGDHEAAAAQRRRLFGRAPARVDGLTAVRGEPAELVEIVGQRQALQRRAGVVGVVLVGDAAPQRGDQRIAAVGQLPGGIAGRLQRLQDGHGGCRRVQPDAAGDARVVGWVIGEDQRESLVGIRLVAQHAPAARQFGDEGDAPGLGQVAQHVELGVFAAPAHALEADRARQDAAVDLGQHHLHRQVARREAVRVGLPLFLRAAGGDQLQHRRVAGQRSGRCIAIAVFRRGDGEVRRVQQDRDAVLRGQRLHRRMAAGVLQRIHRQGLRIQAGGFERGEHRVEDRRIAGLQMGAVEQQQGHRRARPPRRGRCCSAVADDRRQGQRSRRPRAETEGGMAD